MTSSSTGPKAPAAAAKPGRRPRGKRTVLSESNVDALSRTQSDFLASMSHELRTPMNAIIGTADLLAKTPLSSEQSEYVEILRRAGDSLLNLINDVLDLTKAEASQLDLEQTEFSLRGLLDKVTDMVALRAHEKGLALACEVGPDVPNDLVGDPTRLRQVLLSLVGNAIKFTERGQVVLNIAREQGAAAPTALRFTISDTGIGIAPAKLDRVFERFTQADSSATRRFGGSGLGLTISRCLVEAMGGRIWVESAVDRGSVFSFVVPFETWVGATRALVRSSDAVPALPLPALRILLAEDAADNCTITKAYLAKTPFLIEIAETGAIACEMFQLGHYDLVLMDRQMPVMDGLSATRQIRAWELNNRRKRTPIIALTASALKGDREQCLAAGCTAFLTKPIEQEVLLQAIKDHCLPAPAARGPQAQTKNVSFVAAFPTLAARVPMFLLNRREDVVTMLRAVGDGDFASVERLGHNMKGAGASFGFQGITDIGAGIEQSAHRVDAQGARSWVNELSKYLDALALDEDPAASLANRPALELPLSAAWERAAGPGGRLGQLEKPVRKIVVIEDDDDMRETFRDFLQHHGQLVQTAREGPAGLALILAEKPDPAFIDIGLPGLNGYEVARQVRAVLGRSIWLVAMTGYAGESHRREALAAGFDAHLPKPVDTVAVERMLVSGRRALGPVGHA